MRRFLPDAALVGLLFLLPLLFFAPHTLGGRTLLPGENLYQYLPYSAYRADVQAPARPYNHLLSDLVLQNYPWKLFAREQLQQGEVPLWNPHQFAGIPFLAAGQHSLLYPVSLLYLVLEVPAAYGWYTVVNLWLAGSLMLAFVRGLGLGRAAGLLAAVIYQFNGFVLASVVFPMMIGGLPWLPLLLLVTEKLVRGRALVGTGTGPTLALVVGAGAVGLNILAGHVELTLYTLLITAYYAALRLLALAWHTRQWRPVLWRGGRLLFMVALGFGIGSLQFIPLYDFVQSNWRSERSDLATVLSYAHPARDALQFLLPNLYGSPAQHGYRDVFSGEWLSALRNAAGEPVPHTEWGIKNYVEAALYLGILPLLLVLYGLRHAPRPALPADESGPGGHRLIFASLALISLSFMFGLPTYAVVYALPGFNQLNSPFRWIFALTLCVAVLAAHGLAALQQRGRTRGGAAVLAAGGLLLAGLLLSRVFFSSLEPLLAQALRGLARAPATFADARAFYSFLFPQVALLALLLLAAGGLLWWRSRGPRWQLALVAVVVVDLWAATWGFNPAGDPRLLAFTPPAVQWLLARQAEGEVFRYTTLEDPSQPPILNANAGWRYGLDDIRGYDSIIPRQYVDYMRALTLDTQLDFNRIAPFFTTDLTPLSRDLPGVAQPASPLLHLLNVRYILTHRSTNLYPLTAADPAWEPVYEDAAVRIWRNPAAVPRAYRVAAAALPAVWHTPPGQPVDYAALAVPPALTEMAIQRDSGREKFIDVRQAEDGWLIISENWAEGWRAFVRPAGAADAAEQVYPVVRVLGLFQGVALPPGDWTVRLVYSPASFQVGLFGSLISGALATLLVSLWLWGRLVGGSAADASTTARVARNSIAPILLNLFNRGIDFAFLLVMLRLLSPEDVGTYYYLVVIFVWFDIFTNFGLDLFLIRTIARDKSRAGHYFYNITLLRLLLCVAGVALLAGFLLLRQATVTPPLAETAIVTMLLLYAGLFPASLSKGLSSLFYAHEQAEKPAAIATITTINKVIFGAMALLLGYGIVGLAAVSIANNVLTLLVLLVAGRSLIGRVERLRPDVPLLRRLTGESLPLLLNHFLATIFFQIDVIILEAFKGAQVVARYSVAYRWLLAINIVPSFFTQALLPVMSRQAQEDLPALRRTYAFGSKLLFALAVPTAIAFTVLAEPLTYLMGGAQYLPDGAIAIQLMIWSIPIGWLNSLTQYALVALDLQRSITRAFVLAVSFNIISNLLLIPAFSYPAAALTTIASELILFLAFARLMEQGLQQRLPWWDWLWRPLAAGLAMALVTWAGWQVVPLLPLLAGGVVYGLVLALLRPLDADETARLSRMLPGRLRRILARGAAPA
ncbi:MAG: flippase [Anaerolineae bacterium]|nr:flippase [Anaerolineae bacterium]